MKKEKDRTYKLDTAEVANMRLVSHRKAGANRPIDSLDNAREIILKLIEAIKKL